MQIILLKLPACLGIIAHGYIGAVLLQPVKTHLVVETKDEESVQALDNTAPSTHDAEDLENEALDEVMPEPGFRAYPHCNKTKLIIPLGVDWCFFQSNPGSS